MHIFLTGERNVGKTTIINGIIKKIKVKKEKDGQQLIIGGFKTFFDDEANQREKYVYMVPANNASDSSERKAVSLRDKSIEKFEAYPEVFDTYGLSLLSDYQECDLVIMDEIGFMESDAKLFQNEILKILADSVTVLGVVKPQNHPRFKNNSFLNEVWSNNNVEVIEVTLENRKEMEEKIYEKVSLNVFD